VEVEDKPFSTLTPTSRLIKYPDRKNIIVTDTVGFIEDLPKVLLRAFVATLEELDDATLLLHLVDISSPDFEERISTVERILAALNLSEKKQLLVFNKTDKVESSFAEMMEVRYGAISVSCLTGEGIDQLVQALEMELEIVPSARSVS
jgi:GTP-binding protein HflX